MKFNDALFADLGRMATGASAAIAGVREHVVAARGMASGGITNTISREEFEAVAAMAAKARETQERLERRIAALEALAAS